MKPREAFYFDHAKGAANPCPPYSSGEAGLVWINRDDEPETDRRVEILPNSFHALHGHGVVVRLNELDLVGGPIGAGRDAVVAPSAVEDAARIFYDADRMTYGAQHDLRIDRREGVEYRLAVDNREYQRTLSKLQFLSTTASRSGYGLRLRL